MIPFNLGKAVLQGEEASNIELMPGDVVTVFSQKDVRVPVARQTRLVAVEGEVGAPGVYQLLPGETLKSLIARAGGLTPQAYVYGLEFSREETRRRQRENLDQALARLESLSAIQSARDAANRRDEASAASTTAASNAATQAQLARLSQLQPNGRIALELSPSTTTLDALPDVPLEHADRVAVALATGLRDGGWGGGQQQCLPLETRPYRRRIPAPGQAPTRRPIRATCSSCAPTARYRTPAIAVAGLVATAWSRWRCSRAMR